MSTTKLQRLIIGVFGGLLPLLLLWMHDWVQLRSMSHYYYTGAAVAFIGILGSFSLILITYQGYAKEAGEKWSDSLITTVAGIAAALVVLIPTASDGVEGLDYIDQPYLMGYAENGFKNVAHLLSAGVFISLLGYMSFAKFTRSRVITVRLWNMYRTCGIIVWACIGALAILIVLDRGFGIEVSSWFPAYVFWLEAVAIWAFSVAWIRKGLHL